MDACQPLIGYHLVGLLCLTGSCPGRPPANKPWTLGAKRVMCTSMSCCQGGGISNQLKDKQLCCDKNPQLPFSLPLLCRRAPISSHRTASCLLPPAPHHATFPTRFPVRSVALPLRRGSAAAVPLCHGGVPLQAWHHPRGVSNTHTSARTSSHCLPPLWLPAAHTKHHTQQDNAPASAPFFCQTGCTTQRVLQALVTLRWSDTHLRAPPATVLPPCLCPP
jgi:hypothetical protein